MLNCAPFYLWKQENKFKININLEVPDVKQKERRHENCHKKVLFFYG